MSLPVNHSRTGYFLPPALNPPPRPPPCRFTFIVHAPTVQELTLCIFDSGARCGRAHACSRAHSTAAPHSGSERPTLPIPAPILPPLTPLQTA